MAKNDWRWKGKKIEEVREFTYLGYKMQRNGGQEAHVREKNQKGSGGDGTDLEYRKEEIRQKNWERRLWLFDRLVWTVMSHGVEIWAWKEWRN